MTSNWKRISAAICGAALVFLSGCTQKAPAAASTPTEDNRVKVEYVEQFGDFHTQLQGQYLCDLHETISQYADGTQELSRPRPVTLDLSAISGKGTVFVEVAADKGFENARLYTAENGSLDLYNLLLDTEYYYRAAEDESQLASAEVSSFRTTAQAPRNIYLDGVSNVRDMGGYKTADGKTVRQGMLYRGARLNENSVSEFQLTITEAGIETFTKELGIVTEVDFRKSADNENGSVPEGGYLNGVKYVCCPWLYSTSKDPFNGDPSSVKQFFDVLSDEANYPIYFHCSIGTDRTGTMAFLVNALLGVEQEDLFKDYLLSNFGMIEGKRDIGRLKNGIYGVVKKCSGDTLSEKAENYLLSVGVTSEQIEKVRSILLADA